MAIKKRKGRRHIAHHHRHHPLPFNFVSGMVYVGAAIVCITLGAFLYKGVREAGKDGTALTSPGINNTPDLPPGATVIRRKPAEKEPRRQAARPPPRPVAPKAAVRVTAEPIPIADDAKPEGPAQQPADAPSPRHRPRPAWETTAANLPKPSTLTIVPSADTTVFLEPESLRSQNAGAHKELIIKGNEAVALTRFNIDPIRGWTIQKAVWHAKVKRGTARELGFSTILAEWQEGTGTLEGGGADGATYGWADSGRSPWDETGAGVLAVCRGNGYSIFRTGIPDVAEHQTDVWVAVEVDPVVVQALVAGAATGIAISDEKGQVSGAAFAVNSQDTAEPHYLEVQGQLIDIDPPGRINEFKAFNHAQLQRTEGVGVLLRWQAAGDDGDHDQAFFYDIRYSAGSSGFESARRIPLSKTPFPPESPGAWDQVVIEGLDPQTPYTFYIRALDEAGQPGPIAETQLTTGPRLALPMIPPPTEYRVEPLSIFNRALTIEVVDELTGVDPARGQQVYSLAASSGKRDRSFLWERDVRTVHLTAVSGEAIGFQLVFGKEEASSIDLTLEAKPFRHLKGYDLESSLSFHRVAFHPGRDGKGRKLWIGDALIPIKQGESVAPADKALSGSLSYQPVYAELHVPPYTTAGQYISSIGLHMGTNEPVWLSIILDVAAASLPVEPLFTVELMGSPALASLYGKAVFNTVEALPVEQAYHRIAREHRATMACVPYSSSGDCPEPFSPPASGKGLDLEITSWGAWDERFEAYLDGSIFRDLQGVTNPVPHFILPVFDNWPSRLSEGYLCADREMKSPMTGASVFAGDAAAIAQCLDVNYWRGLRKATGLFGDHFAEKRWRHTRGHIAITSMPTNQYKGTSPAWQFGRPEYRDDYLALQAYAQTLVTGPYAGWHDSPPIFRVSVPAAAQLQHYGQGFFGVLTVSDTNAAAWELLRPRHEAYRETLWLESSSLPMQASTIDVMAAVLPYFLQGADGWTISRVLGTPADWRTARDSSLLYSGSVFGEARPYPSMRLKTLRRVQQDFDLLLLLEARMGWSRKQLQEFVHATIPHARGLSPALDAGDFHKLRHTTVQLLTK